MGCKLPEIKRCCFCIPLRYGLIVWGYITLAVNFIFFCDKITTINELLNKEDHDNSVLYESGELTLMIADMVLVIVLIVAAHMKNVKLLRISLSGNLTSVILYTLSTIYMVSYYSLMLRFLYELSSDTASITRIVWMLVGISAATCIEILLKFYIMFLLRKEIKKLETNRSQFSFVSKATEAKCKMECDLEMEKGMFKQIKIEDEVKGAEDTFGKQTVEIGEVIEISCDREKRDYSFNDMNETKCRLEYEGEITNEECLILINDV